MSAFAIHRRSNGARAIDLIVHGVAKPQGSKRHVGGGRMIESTKGLKEWRSDVARVASHAAPHLDGKLLQGALRMTATFYRVRTKASAKRPYPYTAPDVSKLLRAIEDAMEGILFANDAQFCDSRVRKEFGEPARAEITLEEME